MPSVLSLPSNDPAVLFPLIPPDFPCVFGGERFCIRVGFDLKIKASSPAILQLLIRLWMKGRLGGAILKGRTRGKGDIHCHAKMDIKVPL